MSHVVVRPCKSSILILFWLFQ